MMDNLDIIISAATDMAFYDYWLRLRHSRKEAWQAAQSVLG